VPRGHSLASPLTSATPLLAAHPAPRDPGRVHVVGSEGGLRSGQQRRGAARHGPGLPPRSSRQQVRQRVPLSEVQQQQLGHARIDTTPIDTTLAARERLAGCT
jgi:hypothetical protein